MYTRTLRYGKGYAGMMSNKCWIASITGSDNKYGLSRSFIEPDKVEREHFNRPRTMIDFTWELDEGLYEMSQGGDRWFVIVWQTKDGEYSAFKPEESRVKEIVRLMDEGMSFTDARRATKAPAQPKQGE